MKRLRICLIASSRFPVAEPFAGGLEAHTHALARELRERGHTVTLFAAPGSDPNLEAELLAVEPYEPSTLARADIAAPPERFMQEHHAYLSLMLELSRRPGEFDVVHNNSLHHLPVALSPLLSVPVVTTLHTPPTPWLESAMQVTPGVRCVAVSRFTASQWRHCTEADVVLNGVDTNQWRPGPGGGGALWFGRLVAEKAPHLAIDAAVRAGIPIDLAGPAYDADYFDTSIRPRLGPDVRYLGHLTTAQLVQRVGHARVTVVTPEWEEPYGLVAAESLACGTPVAAFDRGALPEVLCPNSGRLARAGDVDDLARAIREASLLSRDRVRRAAVERCSLTAMVDRYEQLYSVNRWEQEAA